MNGSITLGDATCIVNDYLDTAKITDPSKKIAADTDGNGSITLGDATCIVNNYLGTGNTGHVGETK
jgi:hypothetical protein